MATQKQKERAAQKLMRAIHILEAAQHNKDVCACNVDQSAINSAKDKVYYVVRQLEAGRYDR